MKALFRLLSVAALSAFVSVSLLSCDNSDDDDKRVTVEDVLQQGLIKITQNIGEWDEGIVFDTDGFLVMKQPTSGETDTYMQIMDMEEGFNCAITADKVSDLPTSLMFLGQTYYFESLGDTVVVLSKSTDEGIELLNSIPVRMSEATKSGTSTTATVIYFENRDDKVHRVLKALDAILAAGEGYTTSQLRTLKANLDKISPFYYYENVGSILDELDLCRIENEETNDIVYCFTQYASKVKVITFDPVKYAISVRTERTASEVYATSAVVGGRIYCASDHFMDKGEWGVILSRNPSDLSLDNCERCELADKQRFSIVLENLEPNTTYYFKTFYRYKNPKDHGDLVFSYGPKDADAYVDADFFKGEFTTGKFDVVFSRLGDYNGIDIIGGYDDGVLYRGFFFKLKPCFVYGCKVLFKDDVPFEYYQTEEDYGGYCDGYFEYSDKWYFPHRVSGENALKVKLNVGNGKYIESDWVPFKYDWVNGITLK